MITSSETWLDEMIEDLYRESRSAHGDFDLAPDTFRLHLQLIMEKYIGLSQPQEDKINFITQLHYQDLYLGLACARHSEEAWARFMSIYCKYIHDIASFVCSRADAGAELASNLLSDLFLPDSSGNSRIASYEGRSSLSTWLRVIISHRASNERQRRCNSFEALDCLSEVLSEAGISSIEAEVREHRYGRAIEDSFQCSCLSLSARERLILLLRYEQGLQLYEIARLLNVHQSTVTRQLDRIYQKLRRETISTLTVKHHLSPAAVEECQTDIIENPVLLTSIHDQVDHGRGAGLSVVSPG